MHIDPSQSGHQSQSSLKGRFLARISTIAV